MPMHLLAALARQPLPRTITEPAEIDDLRVLRAAGLVAALLPAPDSPETYARAIAITRQGWHALENGGIAEPPSPG